MFLQLAPEAKKFLLLCLWPYKSHRHKRLSNNVPMGQEAPGQMSAALQTEGFGFVLPYT